jgi:hypothetical protein
MSEEPQTKDEIHIGKAEVKGWRAIHMLVASITGLVIILILGYCLVCKWCISAGRPLPWPMERGMKSMHRTAEVPK